MTYSATWNEGACGVRIVPERKNRYMYYCIWVRAWFKKGEGMFGKLITYTIYLLFYSFKIGTVIYELFLLNSKWQWAHKIRSLLDHLLETFQLEICRKHIQWFNPFHPLPIPTCSDALAIEPAKSEENCQLPNTGCNFWRIIFVAKKYCSNSKAITWIIKRKSLKISSIVRCIIEKTRKYFGFVVWRLGYDGGKLSNILHSKRNGYDMFECI